MLRRGLVSVLALTALLVGCGGDDEEDGASANGVGASPNESDALGFDQVEGFTLEHLESEAAVTEECGNLEWVEDESQKRLLAPFKDAATLELLACEGVPYLAYIEYRDAAAAKRGQATALLPYLIASETTVVMPLAGIEERVAAGYLVALEAQCGCGEIVKPGGSAALR